MNELLTNEQMAEADRLAVEMGVPSLTLMENAGRAVAEEAAKMVPGKGARIVVLCGPGNNGGDGFVAARLLKQRGYNVQVFCTVRSGALKGDAAANAERWQEAGGIIDDMGHSHAAIPQAAVVIDALFGAGLTRPLDGDAAAALIVARQRHVDILSVDVPSGLSGDTGQPIGENVATATKTVTFFRRKPGHVLYPGRQLCGELVLADIGIPDAVLYEWAIEDERGGDPPEPVDWRASINQPSTELGDYALTQHKYDRGHALVISGPSGRTGAARLAARAALRAGAGLVTVASPEDAKAENAAHLTAIMLTTFAGPDDLAVCLGDPRINVVLIGPACGTGQATRDLVEVCLAATQSVVLDADALTVFETDPDALFALTAARKATADRQGGVVMTPHEGEFKRLFPDLAGTKLERARAAATRASAVIVLKGPDTVIATPPDTMCEGPPGFACISVNAPPWLATAGSGDVLAGLIAGLLARYGRPTHAAFHAASDAVWLHGECANRFGPGLIAEDLPEVVPGVLKALTDEARAHEEA